MINRYKTPIAIALTILLIVIIFLPIEYPSSINSKGKLLPHKTWLISKETDGRLTTELLDNVTGLNNEFSVTQFERGDAVQFKFNLDLINSGIVQQGDTVRNVILEADWRILQSAVGNQLSCAAHLKPFHITGQTLVAI